MADEEMTEEERIAEIVKNTALSDLNQEELRATIEVHRVIKYLESHVYGYIVLTPSQINAAKILMGKALPDLTSTELTGNEDKPIKVISDKPVDKAQWLVEHTEQGIQKTEDKTVN